MCVSMETIELDKTKCNVYTCCYSQCNMTSVIIGLYNAYMHVHIHTHVM